MIEHYNGDGAFQGWSWDRGDHTDNYGPDGAQHSTTYHRHDGYGSEVYEIGGGLTETRVNTSWGWNGYDADGTYIGCGWDRETHTDIYDADGGNTGSSWD